MRCDAALAELAGVPGALLKATEADWSTEYLAPIISVKVVDSLDEAIAHINRYGSHHTDAILTTNHPNAMRFLREVDSSSVMVNASTRFADGFEYGLGPRSASPPTSSTPAARWGWRLTSMKVVLGQARPRLSSRCALSMTDTALCERADARRAIVLFSGGQDSTACLAWSLERFAQVETLISTTASATASS